MFAAVEILNSSWLVLLMCALFMCAVNGLWDDAAGCFKGVGVDLCTPGLITFGLKCSRKPKAGKDHHGCG